MQVSKFSCTPSGINEDSIAFKEQGNVARLAVADGIGGFECSHLAAKIAVKTFVRQRQQLDASDMEESFRVVLRKLGQIAKRYNVSSHIGTTLTAATIYNKTLYVCHTGDSRLYVIRGNRLIFRTLDQITAIDIKQSNNSPFLLHALVSGQPLKVVKDEIRLKFDDIVLLMTDGVYTLINDQQILYLSNCCKTTDDLCATVKAYVELTGARDDYSFMAVQI